LYSFYQVGGIDAFLKSFESVITFFCEQGSKNNFGAVASPQPRPIDALVSLEHSATGSNIDSTSNKINQERADKELLILESCLCGFAKFLKFLSSARLVLNSPVIASMLHQTSNQTVPFDPNEFVQAVQDKVLDVLVPLWGHPLFPKFPTNFIVSTVGVISSLFESEELLSKEKQKKKGPSVSIFQIDEVAVQKLVDMGFSRAHAHEAFKQAFFLFRRRF
jgi:hypothetical protein